MENLTRLGSILQIIKCKDLILDTLESSLGIKEDNNSNFCAIYSGFLK